MFGYDVDKRIIYAVLGVLVIMSFLGMTTEQWISILVTLPAVIVAITFHEFAHAFAADKLGDTTPRNQGRLTLNPLQHLDPFGFLLLMFAHIGWGKPVQINPNNFNSNKSLSFCETMVSLAGPLMNFFIAIIACILYTVLPEVNIAFLRTNMGYIVMLLLYMIMTVNVGLGVFNLIPLPPLDGEKIFKNFLPYTAQEWLDRNYQTLYMVFMILWFFGVLEIIVSPIISSIIKVLSTGVSYVVTLFL